MSLWKNDESEGGLGKLPDLEPLPELEELLDEFDSEDLTEYPEDNDNSKEVENDETYETPEVEEYNIPDEDFIESPSEESEYNDDDDIFDEDFMESPSEESEYDDDDDIFDQDFMESPSEESEYDDDDDTIEENIIDSPEEDNEDLTDTEPDDYDDDLGPPDMEFEDFKTIDEDDMHDPSYDTNNDEKLLISQGEDDDEDYLSGPIDEEFVGNLLPEVNLDDEEHEYDKLEEEDNEEEDYEEEDYEDTDEVEKSPGFKEIDEEKIKAFFMGIVDKFKGGLDRKPKGEDYQDDEDDQDGEDNSREGGMNKSKFIFLGVLVVIIVALIFAYSTWSNSYSEIADVEKTVQLKDDEGKSDIEFNDFVINDEGDLEVNLVNDGDISKDFSMYITLSEKSLIPFKGDKFECESDIIVIEPGNEVTEKLTCEDGVNKDSEYKVKTEVDEI